MKVYLMPTLGQHFAWILRCEAHVSSEVLAKLAMATFASGSCDNDSNDQCCSSIMVTLETSTFCLGVRSKNHRVRIA